MTSDGGHAYHGGVRYAGVFLILFVATAIVTCGGNDERAGQPCDDPGDCYRGLGTAPRGQVMCLTRVAGGYCTHLCQTDADCCAVDGECRTGIPQVCGPFESTGMMMCFLSCEPDVLGGKDADGYCRDNAHSSFRCRSTGGGATNRKVCVP